MSWTLMRFSTSILILLLVVARVISPDTRAQAIRDSDWDRQAAAKYLDDRIALWFERATELRTGDGQTTCISCHTVVPYLLARPALRKAMHVSEPTWFETKLLKEVALRVDTYPDHQSLSDAKHGGERGTEAVLNALILAFRDAEESPVQPSEHTRKAFSQLWDTQRTDGAWDWMNFAQEPDESADAVYSGAALAAMAAGMALGKFAGQDVGIYVDHLRAYLTSKYSEQNLYRRTWALLASTRLSDLMSREQQKALIAELLKRQNNDGGWSLYKLGPWRWSKAAAPFGPPGSPDSAALEKSDGYATGLIVYTLRQAGMRADQPDLSSALRWLRANQRDVRIEQDAWKCWRTMSLNHDRENGGPHGGAWKRMLMSDTATAFAVLALCSD
jgi:hypothetical protein